MLYCFDVDGTLIRSFMREGGLVDFDAACPRCPGTLELHPDAEWHCPGCAWYGDEASAVYERVEVLPGRLERIRRLVEAPSSEPGRGLGRGARFALVTNQGGVAFGHQTVDQVVQKIARVLGAMGFFFGRPTSTHMAFTHPKATVECWRREDQFRKPGPGMILQAMRWHHADAATTWMIGDLRTDELAANAAGVRYFDAEEFFR